MTTTGQKTDTRYWIDSDDDAWRYHPSHGLQAWVAKSVDWMPYRYGVTGAGGPTPPDRFAPIEVTPTDFPIAPRHPAIGTYHPKANP